MKRLLRTMRDFLWVETGAGGIIKTVIVAGIAFLILGITLSIGGPQLIAGFEATRTAYTNLVERITLSTGNTTQGTVNITYELLGNSVSEVRSVSSSIAETPVAASYNATPHGVLLSGLSGNTTRAITIDYNYSPVSYYTGFTTTTGAGPVIVVLGLIISVGIVGFMGLKLWGKKGG